MFIHGLQKHGEQAALIGTDRRVSFREFAGCADLFPLSTRGLCFIICTNTLASMTGYLAALRQNCVPVLLGRTLHESLFSKLLEDYQPRYVWAPSDRKVSGNMLFEADDYRLTRTHFPSDYELHSSLALMLATSGSTGSPKFVRLSQDNIESNAKSIVSALEISQKDVTITTMPMNYSYGLSILHSHWLCGASVVVTEAGLMEASFWDAFRRREVSSLNGVPYIYEMLARLRWDKMQLVSLKTMTQAGGTLNLELRRHFAGGCRELDIRYFTMYGQTEATARMSILPHADSQRRLGSIGKPIPGGNFWLRDLEGSPIETIGQEGELVYEGPNVFMGYATSFSDLSRGDEVGGVLFTGDTATFDGDGYFTVTGRQGRFLKVFGHRVNLGELEQMVVSKGIECACAGKDDLVQVFVTQNGSQKALQSYLASMTGLSASGFRIVEVPSIPRHESGKVNYPALEELKRA